MTITERFFKYVKINTTPDSKVNSSPTTNFQYEFGKILVEDLKEIGVEEVVLDENGYITGKIPSNLEVQSKKKLPTVAFIAHMDTAPNYSGVGVNPRIIDKYNGEKIILNKELGIEMDPEDFPEVLNYKGEDLIVTDGTTLLGADDKAGIVEIMEMIKYLNENPQIKHGDLRVAFTPDEEIGRGAELLDLERLGADFGYTVDGGEIGEISYENFNAAGVTINIIGRDIHTGSAKGKMINAISLGNELDRMLPEFQRPQYTEKYEGFCHLFDFSGSVEKVEMKYLIRDHFKDGFENKKDLFKEIGKFLEKKYLGAKIEIDIKDSYFNMREKVEPYMEFIELTKKTMKELDIEPKVNPIRGGTDGARLSFRGLPCPNIFTGGIYFHGKYECISVQALEKTSKFMIKLVENIYK